MSTEGTEGQGRLSAFDRLALVAVVGLLGLLAVRQVGSPDAGYHLSLGRQILSGAGWPRVDTFTHTVHGRPYIDTTWGYDTLLAAVEWAFGTAGMVLLHVALVVAIFAVAARTARLVRSDPRSLVLLLLLGGLACESRFEVRPELLSYALLALMLHLLQRHAERLGAPLWAVALLLWIWSNAHSLYVVGFGVLGIFNLGRWIERRRIDRRLLAWSLIAVGLTLVNPYGWNGPLAALSLGRWMQSGHLFGETIGEFQSLVDALLSKQLGFYLVPIACLVAFTALTLIAVPLLWRQRRFCSVLLALAFVPLAWSMVRNAPLLVVACLAGNVWALDLGRLLEIPGLRRAPRARLERAVTAAVVLFAIVFGLRVYNDAYYVGRRRLERFGLEWNALRLPVKAATYIRRAQLPGRMLNQMNVGGYLVLAVDAPVFIDGRLELFGERFFRDYQQALADPTARERCVADHDIGWVIFPYQARPDLLPAFSADPRWRLTYVDEQVVIFVRADRLAPEMVDSGVEAAREPLPSRDLGPIPGIGQPRTGRLAHWLRGLVRRELYPVEPYALGVFHHLLGDTRKLAWHSAEALRQSGGVYDELYLNLGSALHALGLLEPARRCYAIALADAPFYKTAQKRRLREAIEAIDRTRSRPAAGG